MVLANFYCDTPVPPKWVNKIDHIPDSFVFSDLVKEEGRNAEEGMAEEEVAEEVDHITQLLQY